MRRKLQMLLLALTVLLMPTAGGLAPDQPHCFPGHMKYDTRTGRYCEVTSVDQDCLVCFVVIVVEG